MTPEHLELINRIRSSVEVLRSAFEAAPAGKHDHQPLEGEWSVRETLTHLRNVVVMVYGLRLRRLFYEIDPVFADYDEAVHREASLKQPEPVGDVLKMIFAEHEQIAGLLSTLPDANWQRQGRHPDLGPMSIEFLARRTAEHAEEHAAQIANTAKILGADFAGL